MPPNNAAPSTPPPADDRARANALVRKLDHIVEGEWLSEPLPLITAEFAAIRAPLEAEIARLRAERKSELDRIARAVYPNKTDRFTYSVDFMIDEIARLTRERDEAREDRERRKSASAAAQRVRAAIDAARKERG